jgi:hypothetical protein
MLFGVNAFAKDITIANTEHRALSDVRISFYNQARDSIGYQTTDISGKFTLPDGAQYVMLNHPDYANILVMASDLRNDTLYLKQSKELAEVVVTADNVQKHLTHDSYKLSIESMQNYPTFYAALNEIPQLTVLSSGALYYEGDSNVLLLLNGTETNIAELKSIDKGDVYRIDVYSIPPPRFESRGVNSVIDVITKSSLTGGNLGLNVSQAFYPLKGENSAAFFYNYKRSRFSVLYENENRHFNKFRSNQTLDYEFDGVEYRKDKRGLDSKSHIDDNSISLGYQNNLPDSYLYKLSLGGNINRETQKFKQVVSTNSNLETFLANNNLKTRYQQMWLGNYFEKTLGEEGKHGKLYANLKLQRLFSRYYSGYKEFEDVINPTIPTVDEFSIYRTRLDAILCELQYSMQQKPWGQISFSAFETYKHSKYLDTQRVLGETTNILGASAYYYGRFKSFLFYVRMGAEANHAASESLNTNYTYWQPIPKVRITYYPSKKFYAQLSYEYSGSNPTIAEMSETDQWLDTRLAYHGNAGLKPYKTHNLSLLLGSNTKYFDGSLNLSYTNSPNRICNYYLYADKYILETMVNLRKYYDISAQLDVTVKPLGSSLWEIWSRVIWANVHGEGETYRWVGHRFQWMINTSINLKKWNFSAFYQYPGQVAEGQLIMPRAQAWYVDAQFRPIQDLSIGLKLWMPFGKSFKDSQRTVGSALVSNTYESAVYDWTNMVSVTLSWNISFGKNKNSAEPDYDNVSRETGILKK